MAPRHIPRLSHREQSGHSLIWTTFALFPRMYALSMLDTEAWFPACHGIPPDGGDGPITLVSSYVTEEPRSLLRPQSPGGTATSAHPMVRHYLTPRIFSRVSPPIYIGEIVSKCKIQHLCDIPRHLFAGPLKVKINQTLLPGTCQEVGLVMLLTDLINRLWNYKKWICPGLHCLLNKNALGIENDTMQSLVDG